MLSPLAICLSIKIMFSGWSVLCIMLAKPSYTLWFDKTEARISDSAVEISSRFLCRPTAFCSTCWSRGTSESSS